MIKKVSLALVALGLSASAYAGHPAEDVMLPPTVNVTIPQQQGSWNIGVEALYWQVANGDFHYANTFSETTATNGNASLTHSRFRTHAVDTDHDWGVRGDITYHFPGNGRDVQLIYTHFHDNESDSKYLIEGSDLNALDLDVFSPLDAGAPTNPLTDTWDFARGRSDNDYDSIDLVFGQKMDFGQKVTLRAFGGLKYADIDTSDKARFTAEAIDTAPDPDVLWTARAESRIASDFEGLGPRAGMDATVRLGGSFAIMGTVGASLLVGDRDQKWDNYVTVTNENDGSSTTQSNTYRISENTIVVPEMDARIGLNYTHAFSPDTSLGLEVGFEVTNYWNAKENSFVGYFDSMSHDNDFALHGPYFRVELNLA